MVSEVIGSGILVEEGIFLGRFFFFLGMDFLTESRVVAIHQGESNFVFKDAVDCDLANVDLKFLGKLLAEV